MGSNGFTQVTLTGTSYSENFNGILSGLPAGFTVRTGANATSLGTAQALTTAATAWNNTSGAFKNFASATGLISTSTSAEQAASTDRALGVRQSGTVGDPGGAFTFQIANTVGLTDFQLSFKLQSLDVASPRNTVWLVQYGIGTSPSTFTTIATSPVSLATGNLTFTNTAVFVNFGAALDNQSQNVWIRIVTTAASTGSGNRASSAIDDFSLSYSAGGVNPSIIASPSSLTGFSAAVGNPSASQSLTVSGTNLIENITLTPTSLYEVSLDNVTFFPTLTINHSGGIVNNTPVFVRINSSTPPGQANGTISLNAGTAINSVSLSGSVVGVINLSASPYVQNFNTIASGLPIGVTVRTGATVSALGTEVAFATSHSSWNNTGGGFKNFASGNNDQGVAQASATDRAMGVRQVTATDAGVAFVFQIANTSGKINFNLDFNLQSLDAGSPRVTTWRVEYGLGVNPSTFIIPTTTGTLTTGGNTFANNPVHVNFGNALDNQSGIITIRIVSLTGTSGSGNRPSTGIDDFTLTWEDPTAKTITLDATAINFPLTNINTTNSASYKIVSQTNLDQPINITATGPYTISTDNLSFVSDLSVAPADAFNKTIYVKFSPLTTGVYPGTITHNSEGAPPKIINLTGEAIDPSALGFNFNSCTASGSPGSGFLSINITGAQKWSCSQFGRNGTNGVSMNGFSGGAAQTNDAWLISPAMNLNSIVNLAVLSFYSRGEFTGQKLQLYVSTTYDGSSIPNLADWTELNGNFPTPPGSPTTTWTLSDNIDLSAYKSATRVYIAFRYISSPALNAPRWTLDDIAVTDQSTLLTISPLQLDFGEVSVGSNSTSQPVSFKAIGSTDVSVAPPAGYQISIDNTSFTTNAVVIDQTTAAAGITLYVRFSPIAKALKVEGNLHVTAEGLDKEIVALTGSSFPKAETFDVACYNISFFGANSTNSATPEEIALQVANISTVMQKLNMDVVGIEEMSSDAALAQLITTLPGYSSVLSHRWSYSFEPPDPEFPPQKIGFIFNTATMSLSTDEPPRVMFESMYDSARLNLPGHRLNNYPTGNPSSFWASGRLPFLATFNATIDGVARKIRIVVIHAKSGGDADGYTRRQYDVKVLKDSLDAFYPNDRVILIGDYNDRMVTSIHVGHPSSYLPFVNDSVNYSILTKALDAAGKTSFPGSTGMIDHITITNDMVNEYISNSTNTEDPRVYIPNYNATTASDHLPVFSRFEFCKLTPPVNISVSNTVGQCGAIVNFNVSSAMPCGIVTTDHASGSFFPVGITTVHVSSSSGDTTSFTVTVTDSEIPVITSCPVVPTICFIAGGNYTVPVVAAIDNCNTISYSYTITGATTRSGNTNNASGSFNIGTSIITWTVTDSSNNSATCQTTVIVNANPILTIPDAFALPSGTLANTVYIGYTPASSIKLESNITGGGSPYQYLWSNGSTNAFITVSPTINTNYSLTVTDANGCQATDVTSILVKDIRAGNNKVYVCHKPGKQNNTLSISTSGVADHLSHGDMLGSCQNNSGNSPLIVTASPNPSTNRFVLNIKGGELSEKVKIKVTDLFGRTIEQRDGLSTNSTLTIGGNYRPGFYCVWITQGDEIKTIKLLKLP